MNCTVFKCEACDGKERDVAGVVAALIELCIVQFFLEKILLVFHDSLSSAEKKSYAIL